QSAKEFFQPKTTSNCSTSLWETMFIRYGYSGTRENISGIDPRVIEGTVTQTVITHNVAYQVDDLDAYDSDYNDFSTAKAVLMANLSSYGSDVLSEIRPMLYDGSVIAKENNVISIADSEKTLMHEEENINTSVHVNSFVAMNDSVNYVEMCNKCLELEVELIKQHNMVDKDEYNRLSKSFSKLEQHRISVELAMQLNKEIFQKNDISVNQTEPTFDHLNNLKAKDKNNRKTHIYYLRHTMKQATILREIVKQAKSQNSLDSISYSVCKYVKLIQEFLGYVRDTCPDIHKPSEKLVDVTPINKKKIVSFKTNSVKKAKMKEELKPTGKVFTKIGYNWRPIGRTFILVRNTCPLTRITTMNKVPLRESVPLEVVTQESVVTKVYIRRPKIEYAGQEDCTDNEIEFVNQTLHSYYESVGISHETLVAQSPKQHGVVKRQNHTLVKATRTIKPDLSYLHVFSALCYPNNNSEYLGKLQAKANIGIFNGYAPKKKAYRIYNRRIRKIMKTIHVDFDELMVMASEQHDVFQVPVAVAPRAAELAYSPVSTSIDQDALSKNVIRDPSRSVSTRKQLQTDATWCYFDAFLTSVEPKSFKQAMIKPSWIDAMQEEINEFERLQV
nr:retrovirus-related Pol polyprotein from transposon TNT 1-94 [Tanacetum cinerariifolium]